MLALSQVNSFPTIKIDTSKVSLYILCTRQWCFLCEVPTFIRVLITSLLIVNIFITRLDVSNMNTPDPLGLPS